MFKRYGTPDETNARDLDIDATADELIEAFNALDKASAVDRLKAEDIRFITYELIAHRSRRSGVLEEGHLRLLHTVLSIKRPSPRAAKFVDLPSVNKLEEFHAAAVMESENPDISANELSRVVGVSRPTIASWRAMPEYARLVRAHRHWAGHLNADDLKVKALWKASVRRVNARNRRA